MKSAMLKFILALVVVTIFQVGVLNLVIPNSSINYPSFAPIIIGFLFFSTLFTYVLLYTANKKSSRLFINFVIFTMVLKLIIYIGFNAAMIFVDKVNSPPNVVLFICSYFIYTTIEVIYLYRVVTMKTSKK